jgi:DNA-directed RNA polymerase specialized sigma24 family protein
MASRIQQANHSMAGLHWLAFLLTGRCEISVDVVLQTISSQDAERPWMRDWSRRRVTLKALGAIREDLVASADRTQSMGVDKASLPARTWALDPNTTRLHLERALLPIDVFPRAAVLLTVFESMPLEEAAALLGADADLVRKAQSIGLWELTLNLARLQGWTTTAAKIRCSVKGDALCLNN